MLTLNIISYQIVILDIQLKVAQKLRDRDSVNIQKHANASLE